VPSDEWVLQVRAVTVRFGGIVALQDVDLGVAPAEVVGLIGPNGAGKTTLFDVISGLRAPTAGTVRLGGRDITTVSAVGRSRLGLRRTFQHNQVFGALSVEDNVLAAMEWRGSGGGPLADILRLQPSVRVERERRRRAADALALCGLTGVRTEIAGTLPVGLARLVELARAVVDSPAVLLLDEPTSGLGPREAEQLGAALDQLRTEHRCGILLVEHDMGFVMDRSDRVVVLDLGRVIAAGTPDEVRSDTTVLEVYLG
jgi:branched-chain amino acid transport system ATP-binding protein